MKGSGGRGKGEGGAGTFHSSPTTQTQKTKLCSTRRREVAVFQSREVETRATAQERRVNERKTSTRSESRLAGQARDSGGAADHRGLDDEVDLGGEREHHLPGPDPGAVAKGAGGDCQWQPLEKVDRTSCTSEVCSSNLPFKMCVMLVMQCVPVEFIKASFCEEKNTRDRQAGIEAVSVHSKVTSERVMILFYSQNYFFHKPVQEAKHLYVQ